MPEPETLVEKIRLTEGRQKKVTDFLDDEIEKAERARSTQEGLWKRWNEVYEAKPPTERKTFPWAGASNTTVAVTAEKLEAVYARLMGTLHGLLPLWMIRPTPDGSLEWKVAKDIQKALQYRQVHHFKMFDVHAEALFECLKLGTAFVKIPWVNEVSKIWTYNEKGKPAKTDVTFYKGPRPQLVPIHDMLFPIDAIDEQSCRWLAHISRFTPGDMYLKVHSKEWPKSSVEAVVKHLETKPDKGEEIATEARGREGEWPDRATIHEVWARFDVDGDNLEERCVFDYHKPTHTILNARYHFLGHMRRPFARYIYMRGGNSLYGVGLPERLESYQEEITTMHNQRNDNATIANVRGYKARQGSGIQPGHQIHPGKVSLVDDMKSLEAFQLGEVYPSAAHAEAVTQTYAERRSGVSEYTLGRESSEAKTKATATGTLALIQEGNKRFDLAMKEIRRASSEVGMQCIQLYQQFMPSGIPYVEGEEETGVSKDVGLPPEYIREQLQVETVTASAQFNKAVERENSVNLFQLMTTFYDRMLNLASVITNPEVPEALKKVAATIIAKSRGLMERIVDGFDVADAETFIPEMEEIISHVEGRPAGGPEGPASPPGLEDFLGGGQGAPEGPGGAGAPGGGLE